MGEIGNTNKGKGQSCPPAEGSGRTSGQINPGYGGARQGTYRLILMGVAQPQRGHIREKHKQPQANHQAAAQPPMNPPHHPSKKRLSSHQFLQGLQKDSPVFLPPRKASQSSWVKLLMQPCPGHPSPNSCSSTCSSSGSKPNLDYFKALLT